jgi:TatD DNase family protein
LSVDDNLAAARAVGVDRVVQIGCDLDDSRWAVACAASRSDVIACVALHPNTAASLDDAELTRQLAAIDVLAAAGPCVRGIGETGLDYYRTRDDEARARQRRSFAVHIEMAAARGLTLAIHDRDAHADVLAVLDEAAIRGVTPPRVIMHCFSGDAEHARACLDRGAFLSFPGVVTFTNAPALREALAVVPADRLLVETDAPYLTPVPCRGRWNAPYLVPHTVRFIARHLGVDLAWLCDRLSANAQAAYGGAWGDGADA